MRNQVFKKLFSVLLALIMVAGLLPASVLAEVGTAADVATTPAPTEAEQPTESAEPTAPAETETPEVTEVPEPTPENPAATDEPTQGEPTDEGIMPANVMPVQANTETDTPFTIDETKALERESVSNVNYRAVMLDCGRKYFSVDNIKKLIDTMAQYGYNQLQLSFGNGGCRFLLDDMKLVFTDASGATVTLSSDDVKKGIEAGNRAFNGDESVLTQTEMTEIISYAKLKNIAIVPMLNMPGHMNWLEISFSEYTNGTKLERLDITNTTARNFGYALLNKYVSYFKKQGCEYFSFGADESGYTGENMTKFLTGCANVIVKAGMIPRAFNDATKAANMPKSVQITYWWIAEYTGHSSNATDLNTKGYELLNTHGNWYYVVNDGPAVSGKTVEYANGVTVELPMLKKDGSYKHTWPSNTNEFYDNSYSHGSQVIANKGTMFCIWCDNSTGMPADEIISTKTHGALTQLQELAKLYWSTDIATDPGNGETVNVDLIVGDEINGSKTFDVVGEMTTNNDVYIATAEVKTGEATAAKVEKVTSIESGKKYLITNYRNDILLTNTASTYTENYVDYDALKLEGSPKTDSMQKWTFTGTVANNVYTGTVSSSDGKYLSVGQLTASTKETSQTLTLSYNTDYSCWTIAQGNYYLNQLGGTDSRVAGGYTDGASDPGSRWYIYEITEASDGGRKLTITATGEGNTTVKVGNTTYNITVTAPERTETVQLAHGATYNLPEGATDVATSGDNVITVSGTTVTAGQTDGMATVTFVTKNGGGKITARWTYNITVTDINFGNIANLSVQLWITNTWVGADSAPSSLQTVSITAESVYGPDGKLLSEFVPATGYKKDGSNEVKVVYWKGTVLHGFIPVQQGTDYSNSGDDFTKIRYYESNWQYWHENQWKNIDTDTNKDTVVAYYLQTNDAAKEVTTGSQHYGNPPTAHPGHTSANGYNLTAYAVVYPDGTLSKTEEQMYRTGMVRGFWDGQTCNVGTIFANNNSIYKISKITVTWGANKLGVSGDDWYTGNKTGTYGDTWGINWEKKTNSAGEEWYDEFTYWNDGDSEIPMIDGEKLGLNFTQAKNAVLILIYLEVVQTEDTLSIVYWDDNGNKQITTNPMPIPVVVNSDVTFLTKGEAGIQQTSPVDIGMFTLDDDAYIMNSSGAKQGFNKNLSTVPGVTGVYMSGMYKYVSAEISGDGKTLTLHFNLKSATKEKTFVADFGLPLVVTANEFGITQIKSIISMSLEKNKVTMAAQGNYGRATIAEDFSNVTYELNKMLNGKATIPLYVTFNDETTQEFQVHIIPATNVYYEDSFAKFTDGSGAAASATWDTVYDTNITAGHNPYANANQALEALGQTDHNPYGYDPAYKNSTMFSMGSARKVTVTSDMAAKWDDATSAWPTAQFTFKGTGFDIISLTDNTSGAIFVEVVGKTKGITRKLVVNNYYGYEYDDATGKWNTTDKKNPNTLYQIPVMAVRDLEYDEYDVTIRVAYGQVFDKTGDSKYSFWLDAVRVYDPMGKDNAIYNTGNEKEGYPQYIKLRDAVANADASLAGSKALFIDGAANATIVQYKNLGPNNEVYLAEGQAIAFRLDVGEGVQIETIQIGAKAPNGQANLTVNGATVKELSTATEMYYKISAGTNNTFTIANNGKNILSLTNLKITFNAQGSVRLGAMNAEEQAASVMAVRALFAPAPIEPEPEPEPEKTFKPERFEASWSKNVMQGRKATLTVKTSEDVEAITVDGQTIRSYRTRTERVGFGRRAKRITYREFTYSMVAQESADFSVTAINAEGTESEAITARLTVKTRPNSMRDMWDWFKGWF